MTLTPTNFHFGAYKGAEAVDFDRHLAFTIRNLNDLKRRRLVNRLQDQYHALRKTAIQRLIDAGMSPADAERKRPKLDPAPLSKINADLERIWRWIRGFWEVSEQAYPEEIKELPRDTVNKVIFYSQTPAPYEAVDQLDSLIEWTYLLHKQVKNTMRVLNNKRTPQYLSKLKLDDKYRMNKDLLNDFGALLNEATRGRTMVEHGQPTGDTEFVMMPLAPDRDPKLRGTYDQAAQLFVSHHLLRIRKIQDLWRKLTTFQLIANDAGEPELVEGYGDFIKQVRPLVKDLQDKYMVTLPRVEVRTFKQAQRSLLAWYKAVETRALKLYRFIQGYIAARSLMIAEARKAMKATRQQIPAQFLALESYVNDVHSTAVDARRLKEPFEHQLPKTFANIRFYAGEIVRDYLDDVEDYLGKREANTLVRLISPQIINRIEEMSEKIFGDRREAEKVEKWASMVERLMGRLRFNYEQDTKPTRSLHATKMTDAKTSQGIATVIDLAWGMLERADDVGEIITGRV